MTFRKEAIVVLFGSDGSLHPWSTFSNLNDLLGSSLQPMTLQSLENDVNRDGRSDITTITAIASLSPARNIQQCRVLLFFDYALDTRIRLAMTSAVYVEYSSSTPASGLLIEGTLKLRQRGALSRSFDRTIYNTPILINANITGPDDAQFETILPRYLARNGHLSRFVTDPRRDDDIYALIHPLECWTRSSHLIQHHTVHPHRRRRNSLSPWLFRDYSNSLAHVCGSLRSLLRCHLFRERSHLHTPDRSYQRYCRGDSTTAQLCKE